MDLRDAYIRRRNCQVEDAELTDDHNASPSDAVNKTEPTTPSETPKEGDVTHSRSWHAKTKQRKTDVARRVSQPVFTSSHEGTTETDHTAEQPMIVVKKCATGPIHCFIKTASDFSCAIIQYGWECGQGLLQLLNSLITAAYSFLQANAVSLKYEDSEQSKEKSEEDSHQVVELMEAQVRTLLEINKYLREEISILKNEREIAEEMVNKIEQKCREAIEHKQDVINAHELFEILYGAGAAEVQEALSSESKEPPRNPKKFQLTDDVDVSRREGTLIMSDGASHFGTTRPASEVASENLFEFPPEKRQKRDPSV